MSLRPAAAQCLALALHELVTNAAKYGALSAAAGRVEMKWSLASGNLDLHWTENGGPETVAPTAPGFGTRIIKASIEGQLGGQTAFEWATEGVRCYLSVPLGNGVSSHTSGNGQHAPLNQTAPVQRPIAVLGNRVLVVEDEALVAMAIRESLDTLGYSVVGPCSKITEAVVALRHNRVDAAVLDINLGGESVYPLADILKAENIPFIFVTGYGGEELDSRFSTVPVLQKPIEPNALRAVLMRGTRQTHPPHARPASVVTL